MFPMQREPIVHMSIRLGIVMAAVIIGVAVVLPGSAHAGKGKARTKPSATKSSVGGVLVDKPRAISLAEVKFGPVGDGIELGAVEGNPTSGPHASWVRFGPGKSLPNHSYSLAIRGIVLSGKLGGTFRIGADDVAGPPLTAGAMFSFPAGLVHSTTCDSTEPCVFQISQDGPFVVTIEKAA
jgi:hypothetical protein